MGSSLTILVPFPPDACTLGKAQGAGEQVSCGAPVGALAAGGGSLIVPLWIPCATNKLGESGLCGKFKAPVARDCALAIDGKNSDASMSIPMSIGTLSKPDNFLTQVSSIGK